MKTIDKDELFNHLGDFLKGKGIVLSDGSYSKRIRQGCNLLSDAINATQKTVTRARTEVDKKLSKLRESLHRATSSGKESGAPPVVKPDPAAKPEAKPKRAKAKRKTASRKKTVAAKKKAAPKQAK
ncbi:MAG: hypothetical protein KDM81_14665 [Verrucomicrobiae bacterium]|nr:hypothetical protein [Verrucomicrobiae bacterium]MCP5521778.1 hypothetical protein [Verrucomicrobiales bacterium]